MPMVSLQNPAMCLIQTHINISAGLLNIRASNREDGLIIALADTVADENVGSKG